MKNNKATESIRQRAVALTARLQAGQLIRQSLETSTAIMDLQRIVQSVDAVEKRSKSGSDTEPSTEKEIAALASAVDSLKIPFVRGLAHDAKSVKYYCVTADKEHGHGIFSAHDNKEDARFNASLTGGKCCPVDRSEDGRIIKPQALREAERLASEYL